MSLTNAEPGDSTAVAQLLTQFPGSPFLALGQTVFWDEPVKSVLRFTLDKIGAGHMVLGVHDTDYFAKTRVRKSGPGKFVLLAHNDGSTRDLWSAAGEISTLFGSETLPDRHRLKAAGVPLQRLAKSKGEAASAFIDSVTEAWGWRGLVYTGSTDLIVSRLPLKDVGPGIVQLLSWAFENAAVHIGPACCCGEAHKTADTIVAWCKEYCEQHPERYLTDLFQAVLPKIYSLVLGSPPGEVTVDGTANLLRFTPATATLPRFRFVDLFLAPETREIATSGYNAAVHGSTIYTLDKFGAGAIPFDLIVPGRGRGTIRVTPRVVFVETPQPVAIGLKQPISSVQELAAVLTAKLGNEISLVGKAVTLVSMLAQEFIFVFNEEGSTYVSRTRQLNDALAAAGIPLDMRPILRMRYETWDALDAASATIRLPEHLASAFGRAQITGPEFAASWRTVVEEQKQLCSRSAHIKKPVELMEFLQEHDPLGGWEAHLQRYQELKAALLVIRQQAIPLHAEVHQAYENIKSAQIRRAAIQTAMGEHFRSVTAWSQTELEQRNAFARDLDMCDFEIRSLKRHVMGLKEEIKSLERGAAAAEIREHLDACERDAEMARLKLVRNALLTADGLAHTNHRPSAWWLPMADATGSWFRRIAETTAYYTEPLLTSK
jgi:hypothetical protein